MHSLDIGLVQFSEQRYGHSYLPYAVGLLQSYVQGHAPGRYRFRPLIYARRPLPELLTALRGVDVAGFSAYIWNLQRSLALAAALKAACPETLIVFGGPQIPDAPAAAEAFLRAHPFIDLVSHGEGEALFLALLERLPDRRWQGLQGLSWLDAAGHFYHAPPGPRLADLDTLPSPYLTGVFDPLLQAAPQEHWIATWETNRGCPFSCSFCDWGGLIQSQVKRFDMARIRAEINWFAQAGIADIFCADANFGMLERDLEIAQALAAAKQRYGRPHLFQTQTAKNVKQRTLEIQRLLAESGLNPVAAISLQSLDAPTLKSIRRQNISTERFREMQAFCQQHGIFSYTDLILALPGESYDSFADGVSEVIRLGQHNRILFHNAALLPNAEMAQPAYRERHGIESVGIPFPGQDDLDGIRETLEIIVATATLPREDWVRVHVLAWVTNLVYFTHKPLQLALMVLHSAFDLSYRSLLEPFSEAESLRHYPTLRAIQARLAEAARILQAGRPQTENPSLFSLQEGVQLTPDLLTQIRLARTGRWPAFFQEAGHLLLSRVLAQRPQADLALLREALQLSEAHFQHLFYGQQTFHRPAGMQIAPREIPLRYNLWDFYQAQLRGENRPIEVAPSQIQLLAPVQMA
ncbi:MAG: B12-binding domain-containing radical SAM protein [Candidatus Sericytochromatia bacterium]